MSAYRLRAHEMASVPSIHHQFELLYQHCIEEQKVKDVLERTACESCDNQHTTVRFFNIGKDLNTLLRQATHAFIQTYLCSQCACIYMAAFNSAMAQDPTILNEQMQLVKSTILPKFYDAKESKCDCCRIARATGIDRRR